MKRLCSMLFTMLLAFSLLAVPALAADNTNTQTVYYEDGSYAIVTVNNNNFARSSNSSKSKSYTYHNPLGQKCFTYTLYGLFTYDGTTSWVSAYDYSVEIHRSGWSLENHFEYVSGGTVYGTATFKEPSGKTRTVNISLSCDKNGNIT